jgi:hypothetical protein
MKKVFRLLPFFLVILALVFVLSFFKSYEGLTQPGGNSACLGANNNNIIGASCSTNSTAPPNKKCCPGFKCVSSSRTGGGNTCVKK